MNHIQISHQNDDFPSTNWGLVRRKGNLEELVRTYWKPIYFYIRKKFGFSHLKAEELTQELFCKILNHPEIFKHITPKKGKFRHYLLQIMNNLSLKNIQQEKKVSEKPYLFFIDFSITQKEEILLKTSCTPEEIFNIQWAKDIVNKALTKLENYYCGKPRKKDKVKAYEAFKLKYIEGEENQQIAEKLNCSPEWVYEKTYRLKKKYQEFLIFIIQETLPSAESVEEEIKNLLQMLSGE